MKLYLISQTQNNDYDTYDSAVVAAPDEETARLIHPCGDVWHRSIPFPRRDGIIEFEAYFEGWGRDWCSSPDKVSVEYIGEAKEGTKQGVILASFNAG